MKLETNLDDNTGTALVIATCAIGLGAILFSCFRLQYKHVEEMARLGYEEVTIQGSSQTAWQKPHPFPTPTPGS